jgi:hypothetical protein
MLATPSLLMHKEQYFLYTRSEAKWTLLAVVSAKQGCVVIIDRFCMGICQKWGEGPSQAPPYRK